MATGAYLAERSVSEVAEANLEREHQEIAEHPDEEREELSLFLQLKGLSAEDADALAQRLEPRGAAAACSLSRSSAARTAGGNPVEAAAAGGISTAIGAFIPVIPFFFTTGTPGDHRRGDHLAHRALPGRRGEVPRHPAVMVGCGPGDDGRGRDRRWRDVHHRALAPDVGPATTDLQETCAIQVDPHTGRPPG